MPRKRLDKELWAERRIQVWERDSRKCTRCKIDITIDRCHIDHIKSGLLGTNKLENLRTLCSRCHVLRADIRHQGMIAKALQQGIIEVGWRNHVWEDETR
ncbi:HNH endonuclease [Sutcliffiella sp. NC1]|uniref:HNH endonuclease n=1 Tax=Sutcliffiella sp. NC1 TaxID=3004096 RepID=UPI0022DE86A8|nr:HNH endonuclease signature motif containing protein [Sutcliffiella sp. NC1]WBL15112.1 HNH endonuclease signature motif containing protein [Sutcliffiella sp. NC1]